MNCFGIAAIFAVLAATSAAPSTSILQGPSSRTTLVGPDGSAISSIAPGGAVLSEDHHAITGYAAPTLVHSAYAAPLLAHQSTVVAGPSGTIATSRGLGYGGLLHHTPLAYHGYYL